MKLYNTLTREREEFKPLNKNEVKIYTCGPTVYNFQHIGNYASYVYWDLLVRALKLEGYNVKRVLNLTDVGHLVSDQDEGEDKLEKGARREGKSVWEIAKIYIDDFLNNFSALNLLKPDVIARATDYIEESKKLVKTLIEKGYTYETEDGIYFDTSKFPTYADFAKLDLEGLKAGARVDFNSEKRNPSDFAVWKFIKPNENHVMRWDFLDRPGYPGWHLECSTIIRKELGGTIDIHTGGIDHVPVHHTNEIAQYESAFGEKLSNFWLHCDFIKINGEKISKSLGNVFLLNDLKNRGYSPLDFKMWVLEGNYQTARNFTFEELESAKIRHLKWRNNLALNFQANAPENNTDEEEQKSTILELVGDNLNSPKALAYIDQQLGGKNNFWTFVDELFGLNLINSVHDLSESQKDLIKKREEARAKKDFATSDRLREELEKENITILDTKNGPIWQYLA